MPNQLKLLEVTTERRSRAVDQDMTESGAGIDQECDPKAARFMVDHLYQFNWQSKAENCNGLASEEDHVPSPESPVAQTFDNYEDPVVASPHEEATEASWSRPSKPSKKNQNGSLVL